jgi:hypothetical protein
MAYFNVMYRHSPEGHDENHSVLHLASVSDACESACLVKTSLNKYSPVKGSELLHVSEY